MENSRKSNSNKLPLGKGKRADLAACVADALILVVPPDSSILLGLSGGVDSIVLLHLLQQLAPRYSWRLSALHVHHRISPHADAWASFCAELCTHYHIPFQLEHVDIAPLRGYGLEAAARKLRHAALDRQQADFVVLAHHLDDQAETLLLQLLRGAGTRGASAMPLVRRRNKHPTQLRPLLDVTREQLLAYAKQHKLQWIEDESNANTAYPRNFLRHCVLPQLEQRFPAYRETLGRSARHFAEASALLDELAQQDACSLTSNSGDEAVLEVASLQALSLPRAKNLLRYFLHSVGAPMPQTVQLEQMLQQLCTAKQDAAVQLKLGDWQLIRYQGKVYALPALPEAPTAFSQKWNGEAVLKLPELHGTLHFLPTIGQGLSRDKLRQAAISVRLRQGAEKIRLNSKRPSRTLKNLLQEQNIPPWQRERLPLLFCDATLIAIPGIGVASEFQAGPGEEGVVVNWEAGSGD